MQPTEYEKQFTQNFQNIYIQRYPDPEDRPMTYFDITIDSIPIGRIIFELFTDVVPKTCENFRQLCISHQKYESYFQTPIHKIIPNYVVQGGDITRGDGRGGYSIYGKYFEDENFRAKHKIEGLLSMANKGPNTNNSQFMITLYPLPWLDGKHVVFGRVIKGYDVVRKIEDCGSENGKPKKKVIISNCGEIGKHFGLKINKDTMNSNNSLPQRNYFGNQNNSFNHDYGNNFGNGNFDNKDSNGFGDSGLQGNESFQNSNFNSNNNNGFMGSNINNFQNDSNKIVNTFSNNRSFNNDYYSGNNSFQNNFQNFNSSPSNNSESNFQNNSNFQESSTFIYNYNDPNKYNNIP